MPTDPPAFKSICFVALLSLSAFVLNAGSIPHSTQTPQGEHFNVLPEQHILLYGDSIVRGYAFGNYTNPSPLRTLYGIAAVLMKENLDHAPVISALSPVWEGVNPDGTPKIVDTMASEIALYARRSELRWGDWIIYEDAGELDKVKHPAPWPDATNMYRRQREALRGMIHESGKTIGPDHVLMMTMFDYDPIYPWCRWDAPLDDGVHSGNDAIRDEATANGVRVIDMNRIMDRAEDYVTAHGWGRMIGPDGIHPNVFGNYVMTLSILGTLGADIAKWKIDSLEKHYHHPNTGGDVSTVWGFSKDPTDAERSVILADLKQIVVDALHRPFTTVLHRLKILDHPAKQPEHTTRPISYEVGSVFQLDGDHCLLVASMREQGGHDFEVGNDAFVFRTLQNIKPERAIPINRLDSRFRLESGKGTSVLAKYPASGGFVPQGAKLPDGSPHPAAGTGFLVSGSLPFLPDRSSGHPEAGPEDRPFDLIQLRWDGKKLKVTSRSQLKQLMDVRIGRIGLSNFCPQDRGFLCPFGPDDGSSIVVIRFNWDGKKWKPTAHGKPFVTAQAPANPGARAYRYLETEPSIQRVGDRYLVYTRGYDPKGRMYVSDDGLNYSLLFEHTNHTVPQVLNQQPDGSLYLVTNPGPGWIRNPLIAYPLHNHQFGEPVVIHDERHIRGDKGTEIPFCDHARGANVTLEGRSRHFLVYRVCDMHETDGRGAPPFPQTGLYLAELEFP